MQLRAEHLDTWAQNRVHAMLALDRGDDRVVGVMVATIDGRAAIHGTSGELSSQRDQALFRAWRSAADGVLVGARTLEAEHYRGFDPSDRHANAGSRRFLTISRRADINLQQALLSNQTLPLTVYTEPSATTRRGRFPDTCDIVPLETLSPAAVLADARARYGHKLVVCEGGPMLLTISLEERQLTDLSLTTAPTIAGSGPTLLPNDRLTRAVDVYVDNIELHEGVLFAHHRIATKQQYQ